MKKQRKSLVLTFLLSISGLMGMAQGNSVSIDTEQKVSGQNFSERFLSSNKDQKLTIGGYAQIDYNQPFNNGEFSNGELDIHRMILLFGYQFTEKTRFVTEIEIEHVEEVFVEQAFVNHEVKSWLNLRGGLLLVPMGIINQYHEPPTYNGVERPNLDGKIAPTTWRELGIGAAGRIDEISMRYQAYLTNGFSGYDNDAGKFRGTDGYRKGRQKGAESYISSPNFTTRIEHYGIPGLKLGLSTYFGKSQSDLYDGLSKDDQLGIAQADSSVINIFMTGFDARYKIGGFETRGQFYYAHNGNTKEYNEFTSSDLGSQMIGGYVEAGYDVLHKAETEKRLVPFARYERYNTHAKTSGGLERNDTYDRTDLTVGAGFWLAQGVVVKADYQAFFNVEDSFIDDQLNVGIGVWF